MVNNCDDGKRIYFGALDTTFKKRYRNNIRSFTHERYCKCTELSHYIWLLKRNKKIPNIELEFVRKVFGDAKSNDSLLCLKEEYLLLITLTRTSY